MCIFRFVLKFNIFNIFVKFSIFMQNFQYLRINPQYLCKIFNICTFAFCSPLSLVCVQADLSSFRSQREGLLFRFCPICVQNLQFYVFVHILVFFSLSLWSVYKQIYLASGVREREYHHLYLHLSYLCVFSYFCTLFKSLINW